MTGTTQGNFVEVFSSVQGEGPHVGESTLFVRLGECDLRCRWCDSPHTWRPARSCRFELRRGSGDFESVQNPVSLARVLEAAQALEAGRHRFVSLTGGEPLLQPEVVGALAVPLRGLGPRVLLETHGLHAEALARVVDCIDVVSMDWKLASDVRRADEPSRGPARPFHEQHARFLAEARRAPEVVVKIVVTTASRDEEIDEAVALVAKLHREATLVLQPVTPFGPVRERPPAGRLLQLADRASRVLPHVRVIPQTHPILGAP